jgi:hypothetical protein
MKHKITTPDDPLTENEIMKNRGYRRIYDAGLHVWVIK